MRGLLQHVGKFGKLTSSSGGEFWLSRHEIEMVQNHPGCFTIRDLNRPEGIDIFPRSRGHHWRKLNKVWHPPAPPTEPVSRVDGLMVCSGRSSLILRLTAVRYLRRNDDRLSAFRRKRWILGKRYI